MRAKIDENTVKMMHKLANGFAQERVDKEIALLEDRLKGTEGRTTYSREQIKKEIGRMLATAYAKGYADCYERKEQRRLLI